MDNIIHLIRMPVALVAHRIHDLSGKRVSHEHAKFFVGFFFMVTGSSLGFASGHIIEIHWIGHIGAEMMAGFLHGTGMVPFADILVKKMKLQETESNKSRKSKRAGAKRNKNKRNKKIVLETPV